MATTGKFVTLVTTNMETTVTTVATGNFLALVTKAAMVIR
jgi:hypothetical protein